MTDPTPSSRWTDEEIEEQIDALDKIGAETETSAWAEWLALRRAAREHWAAAHVEHSSPRCPCSSCALARLAGKVR